MIIVRNVVHTARSFGFYSSSYRYRSRRPCLWTAAGAALSPVRRHIFMLRNICGYSSGSDRHKELSSLGTRSAMCHCGVGRDVADVSNDCSGFSRSTLNMVAVGSFETSAVTLPTDTASHKTLISYPFILLWMDWVYFHFTVGVRFTY
jgi:hypothetical protein